MNKLGIITMYYKSKNYGGVLQAYALAEYLRNKGFDVEQICYKKTSENALQPAKLSFRARISGLAQKFLMLSINSGLEERNKNFDAFTESIPHSEAVYTDANIIEANKVYDTFITGSDQVWNPIYYNPAYFLDFADENKKCLSYAASIANGKLTDEQKEVFKRHFEKYSAISLRENDGDVIQDLTDIPVKWVLDPTMLLTKDEWDKVCAPKMINEKYLFCYFLGRNEVERQIATEFAKKNHLKLVTIPHLMGSFERSDKGFGDQQILSASPQEFISLIKNAEFVFTDSFHATSFSNIYDKEYFVFQRSGFKGMSSRIYSVCSLFGTQLRFLDTVEKQNVQYIEKIIQEEIGKEKNRALFDDKKKESEEFLLKALKD